MVPVLEAVPNVSEGRDSEVVSEIAAAVSGAGADLLDLTSDPDHHRSVLTFVGDPSTVERAALAAARVAVESIDLASHEGVHPRIGALDVLPFVPLSGLTMEEARASAWRVGEAMAEELGVPVYLYGEASDPPGRRLADLRRGGFEALREGFPSGRLPDFLPRALESPPRAHPSAGATCVGARKLLLAWNVFVEGLAAEDLRSIASSIRETGGGFPHLRALGLVLASQDRMQISMNLEEMEVISPWEVFEAIEREVAARGGRVGGTEVIGMVPDALVLPASANRLGLVRPNEERLLSRRLGRHISQRASRAAKNLANAVEEAGAALPPSVRAAVAELTGALVGSPHSDSE